MRYVNKKLKCFLNFLADAFHILPDPVESIAAP